MNCPPHRSKAVLAYKQSPAEPRKQLLHTIPATNQLIPLEAQIPTPTNPLLAKVMHPDRSTDFFHT